MNILYATIARLPTEKAHGIQIMNTCAAVAKNVATLTLIVPWRKNTLTGSPFDFYQVPNNFTITTVPGRDFISTHFFGPVGFWLQNYFFSKSVTIVVKQKKVDAIITRDFLVLWWLRKVRIPLFYEMHTMPKKLGWFHRLVWKQVTGIIVISDGLRAAAAAAGIAESKLVVIRDGVDTTQFNNTITKQAARKILGLSENQKMVIYTGHLYDWKGVHTLAAAARKIDPGIIIYFVGGTESDSQKFKECYTDSNIRVMGWKPHQEIPLWLASSDVLVIPNSAKEMIGSTYTSPLKLFEYSAANRPIVATDVPALREVLGDRAVFAQPDDAESLAQAIETVFADYTKWVTVAQAQAHSVDQYSWEARGEAMVRFIERQLKNIS